MWRQRQRWRRRRRQQRCELRVKLARLFHLLVSLSLVSSRLVTRPQFSSCSYLLTLIQRRFLFLFTFYLPLFHPPFPNIVFTPHSLYTWQPFTIRFSEVLFQFKFILVACYFYFVSFSSSASSWHSFSHFYVHLFCHFVYFTYVWVCLCVCVNSLHTQFLHSSLPTFYGKHSKVACLF